jgi:hypothetical protein
MPRLDHQEHVVFGLGRRDAGLADRIAKLVGVGVKAAVPTRPFVGNVDIPTDDQRVGPRVEDLEDDTGQMA